MSQTEQLLRAYFDAFNAHDKDARLALLSEDVRHDINEGATEIGKEAFGRFIDHMATRYREQITDIDVMISTRQDGVETGAVEFTCSGSYIGDDDGLPPAHGQTYSIPAAAFFTVQGGKITRVTSYYNLRLWSSLVS